MEIGKVSRTRGGEEKENVDVVGYLCCCREAIYANVMISRNIYGERIEILPRRYIVIPGQYNLERRGDTTIQHSISQTIK